MYTDKEINEAQDFENDLPSPSTIDEVPPSPTEMQSTAAPNQGEGGSNSVILQRPASPGPIVTGAGGSQQQPPSQQQLPQPQHQHQQHQQQMQQLPYRSPLVIPQGPPPPRVTPPIFTPEGTPPPRPQTLPSFPRPNSGAYVQRHQSLSMYKNSPLPPPPPSRPRSTGSMEKSPIDEPAMSASGRELDLGINVVPRRIGVGSIGDTLVHSSDRDRDGHSTFVGGLGGLPAPEQAHQPPAAFHRPDTTRRATGLEWIVPTDNSQLNERLRPKTVSERLQDTVKHATEEERKYAKRAMASGYALNIAIGLQVLVSALITGLSATGHTQIVISILGGLGTVIASYLARARGSGEPELSITRTKDLQKYLRNCEAFVQDHGNEIGHQYDNKIQDLRNEFEELLGHANGERKLAPPA